MQEIAVFLIVGGAVAFVGRSWWMTAQGKKGCGGCNSCSASKNVGAPTNAPAPAPLVQIDLNGSWKK